jgi:nicotinate-nucleotide pyrophosphorylase (carboxylating)
VNLDDLIREALREDLPTGGDMTSERFVPPQAEGHGWIEARENVVVSGLEVAAQVFHVVDSSIGIELSVKDGSSVIRLQRVMKVRGAAGSVLKAERTALNFLCHLSGIAAVTRQFVDAVQPWGTKILCTRKTTPGLRKWEIAAVRHGGGDAYRTNLSDAVLLKDNHLGMLGGMKGVRERLAALRNENPRIVEDILRNGKIEASLLEDVEAAVEMGWPQILLDNFTPANVAAAVKTWGNRVFLEMSGGVNLTNVRDYAATGVHAISIGGLTHSAKAADFSLEVEWRSV